jgi:hypothetical protein
MYTYIHILHTYIHMYTYIYYIHACIHTYMHAYIHTYIHTYTHTHTYTYAHTYLSYIHTHMRTYIFAFPHCAVEDTGRGLHVNARPEFNQFLCGICRSHSTVAAVSCLLHWQSYLSANIYRHRRHHIPGEKTLNSSQSKRHSHIMVWQTVAVPQHLKFITVLMVLTCTVIFASFCGTAQEYWLHLLCVCASGHHPH